MLRTPQLARLALADKDSCIAVGGNGRPCSNKHILAGEKKPATVYREWAALLEAAPVVESLHNKLLACSIWLWKGEEIEQPLGLVGAKKAIASWAPFKKRLRSEAYRDVVANCTGVEAPIEWLSNNRGPG